MGNFSIRVNLPERGNEFYNKMATLLPPTAYNTDSQFMVPRLTTVTIQGVVTPLSVVKVFINNIDQSPVPDIVSDDQGNWLGTITLHPGANTIQVQFFSPEINRSIEENYQPQFSPDFTITHPTLFARFSLDATLRMLLWDGTNLYLFGLTGVAPGLNTLVAYDTATGIGNIVEFGTGPLSAGNHRYAAMDSNWVYVAHSLGDASIKVSRWAKNFSSRLDLTYATAANTLYVDETNLFATRNSGDDILAAKIDPTTMTRVGPEASTKMGATYEYFHDHNQMTEDGSGNLVIPVSHQSVGDSPTAVYEDGSPGMGSGLVFAYDYQYRKLRKSDMVDRGYWSLRCCGVSPSIVLTPTNSLVRFGGYYYTVVQANPGRILKLEEQTVGAFNYLNPIEVTPLPFSTVDADAENTLPPQMRLGPNNYLYVASNGSVARLAPGSTSFPFIPRGTRNVDATADSFAVVSEADDMVSAFAAANTAFTDRSQTYTVAIPAIPTGLKCHFNTTQWKAGVAWDPVVDGAAMAVEMSVNGDDFIEMGREYVGNGFYTRDLSVGRPLWAQRAGDALVFRVRAFNSVGLSGYSSTATVTIPFLAPPIQDQTDLVVTGVGSLSVDLQWKDHEIDLTHPGEVGPDYNRTHFVTIYRSEDGVAYANVGHVDVFSPWDDPTDILTFTDNTVEPSTHYYYKVRGESVTYLPGNYSNVVETTTLVAPPSVPDSVVAQTEWAGVKVTWAPGAGGGPVTGYTVKRSTNGGGSYSVLISLGVVTEYTDASAIGQAQVMYKVYASGPGGDSADSTATSNIIPVYSEISIDGIGNTNGPLLLDASYAYAVSGNSDGSKTAVTRVSLADSSVRTQNLEVYTPVGTYAGMESAIILGGYLYIIVKDQGEANARILKVNTATLLLVSSLPLTNGSESSTGGVLFTDGTDCWAINGPLTAKRVTRFDPVGMTVTLNGPALGATKAVQCATAFGGDIYLGYRGTGDSVNYVARVDQLTLEIVESVASGSSSIRYMVNDGTNIYSCGPNTVSGKGRVEKYSLAPLAFVGDTGDLGNNSAPSMVYLGGSLYAVQQSTTTYGIMKISTTPALVSHITQTHMQAGHFDGIRSDGTYVYASTTANGYVAREALASF